MRPMRLAAGLIALVLVAGACSLDAIEPAVGTECRVGDVELLTAQTVPSATYIPCLANGLEEWRLESTFYGSSGSRMKLVTDRLDGSWEIEFGSSCDPGDLPKTQPIEKFEGDLFQQVDTGGSRYREEAYYQFSGGCVVSTVDLPQNSLLDVLLGERDDGFDLVPRAALNQEVEKRTGGRIGLDPE